MKKLFAMLLTASMLFAMLAVLVCPIAADEATADTFDAGAASPTISTAADYIAFFNAVYNQKLDFDGKTITMLNDITLNDTTAADWYTKADAVKLTGTNDGWMWFKGTFDGGNHTLKGAIPTGAFRSDVPFGIFPYVGNGGVIKNLVVDGFYVCSPNTEKAPEHGSAGVGGLIGFAKFNVTIDNVTMRNGIVTCVENGKGGLGAMIGSYHGNIDDKTQDLTITNCVIEDSVQVFAGANSSAYTGGLVGVVHGGSNNHFRANLIVTGSAFAAVDASGKTLDAFGYCFATGTYAHVWTVRNDATGYKTGNNWFMSGNSNAAYAEPLNALLVASGCWGASAAPVVRAAGVQTRSSDNGVRFVGLVKIPESLKSVTALGFEVTVGDKTVGAEQISCTKVYTSILEDGKTLEAPEGYYYFTFVVTGVTAGTTFAWSACATVDGKECKTTVGSYTYTPAAD